MTTTISEQEGEGEERQSKGRGEEEGLWGGGGEEDMGGAPCETKHVSQEGLGGGNPRL